MNCVPLTCFLVILSLNIFSGNGLPAGVRSLNPASGHLPSLNLASESRGGFRAAGVETGVGAAIPLERAEQGLEGMGDRNFHQGPARAAGVKTRVGGVRTLNPASGRLPSLNLASSSNI